MYLIMVYYYFFFSLCSGCFLDPVLGKYKVFYKCPIPLFYVYPLLKLKKNSVTRYYAIKKKYQI